MPLGRTKGLRADGETRFEMTRRMIAAQKARAKAKKFRERLAKIKADKALIRQFAIEEERSATSRREREIKRRRAKEPIST